MTKLLIISNGNGEDFIAARLSEALLKRLPDLQIEAFPLVGLGVQLARAGVDLVGPRRRLPAAGFTLHSPRLLWRDLRAGLLPLTVAQASFLRTQRPSAVLVVGDVYAQLHASLVRAPRRVLQPLVSVHHFRRAPGAANHRSSVLRYFMESFRGPELRLLRRAQKVYTRDAATAAYLSQQGVADAACLGNPMMDGLAATPLWSPGAAPGRPVVALLPGSRGQAVASAQIMLRALTLLPAAHGLVAWTHEQVPPRPAEWDEEDVSLGGVAAAWVYRGGQHRVWWVRGRFPAVLASADAALGTAGTANEQAVGLGLPVVAFQVAPFYGRDYLLNQARLLGDGLLVAQPQAHSVAQHLRLALQDQGVRQRALEAGRERMGGPGASAALAADLADWLQSGLRGV